MEAGPRRECLRLRVPLAKDLRLLVAAQTAGSISALSERMKAILDRIHFKERLSFEEIARLVRVAVPLGVRKLRITGGEPLLQAGALAEMLAHLPDISVEIETNGTVAPPARLDVRVDQYNVSPKLAHSGNPADLALIPERLDAWAADPRAFLKFVIAAPEDVEEVLTLQQRYRFTPERVFLMAEGTDSATLRARQVWLSDLCLKHGFRMSDRLHIHLYGDTRGT